MQVVTKPNDKITKLWGKPKVLHAAYRQIKYLIRLSVPEGELLLHTVTGELLLLDHAETRALDKLPGVLPECLALMV